MVHHSDTSNSNWTKSMNKKEVICSICGALKQLQFFLNRYKYMRSCFMSSHKLDSSLNRDISANSQFCWLYLIRLWSVCIVYTFIDVIWLTFVRYFQQPVAQILTETKTHKYINRNHWNANVSEIFYEKRDADKNIYHFIGFVKAFFPSSSWKCLSCFSSLLFLRHNLWCFVTRCSNHSKFVFFTHFIYIAHYSIIRAINNALIFSFSYTLSLCLVLFLFWLWVWFCFCLCLCLLLWLWEYFVFVCVCRKKNKNNNSLTRMKRLNCLFSHFQINLWLRILNRYKNKSNVICLAYNKIITIKEQNTKRIVLYVWLSGTMKIVFRWEYWIRIKFKCSIECCCYCYNAWNSLMNSFSKKSKPSNWEE